MSLLLNYLEQENLDWVNLNTKDKNGDTCLSLACLQGYSNQNELESNSKIIMENRYKIVKMLIPKVDLNNSTHNDMNNPLQWCMFYGDIKSGKALFQARPRFIEETNGVKETLFDMFVSKRICLNRFEESYELTHFLCREYCENLKMFFEKDELKFNINPKMKNLIKKIRNIVSNFQNSQIVGYIELGKIQTSIFVYKDKRLKSNEGKFLHKMLAMCVFFNEKDLIKFFIRWLGHQDSNLGSRDQNPLPYRLAMPHQRQAGN